MMPAEIQLADRASAAPLTGPAPILFTHYGAPWIRGSERVLLDILRNLDRDRFSPVVWCNTTVFADAARELDVPTSVSPMPILLGWDAPRFDLAAYRRLVHEAMALIRGHGIRLVHANSGAPNQWLVPATRRLNVPLITHLHAHYGQRERCALRLHESPLIVGCSGAVLRGFIDDGVPLNRMRVIYNGVDERRLDTGDARGLRDALGIHEDEVVGVIVGSLLPPKGQESLLRAVARLRERGCHPVILLIGDGPDAARLRRLAEELELLGRVHFLGERRDVGAILRDVADFAVLPSHIEAFGLAIAEAGLFGVPGIASNIPGLDEVVDPGRTGLLVPVGAVDELADAIATLVSDPETREAMGDRAASHVRERFTVQTMVNDLHRLYEEQIALGRHRRPPVGEWLSPWWSFGTQWLARRARVVRRRPPERALPLA